MRKVERSAEYNINKNHNYIKVMKSYVAEHLNKGGKISLQKHQMNENTRDYLD